MKVKIRDNSKNNYCVNSPTELWMEVLKHNGLEENKLNSYIKSVNNGFEYDYSLLDNIDEARYTLLKHIKENNHIHIIVDCDVDGYTSASILYQYLTKDMRYQNVTYCLHTGKKHGITDDIQIPKETKLLLVPDASSEEHEKHKLLKERGVDVIILDHHNATGCSPYAIVVNNQLCNYPNKYLSGVGIVYKFLQSIDKELGMTNSKKYLDLVAFGLLGDSMNCIEVETMSLVKQGLNNINNHLLQALLNKVMYSTNGVVNPLNMSFYTIPIVNAIIRVGKQDEKEMLFKAMCEEYEEFDYKKRGSSTTVRENIFDRTARIGSNVKSQQKRIVEKILSDIEKNIDTKNNVIVAHMQGQTGTLTGLLAIKLASKYNKPAFVIHKDEEDSTFYRGSGRNYDNSTIPDLQSFVNNSLLANAEGHSNAFGLKELSVNNLTLFIDYFNKNSVVDKEYTVDFKMKFEDMSDELFHHFQDAKNFYSTGVKEPVCYIEDITVEPEEVFTIGKNANILKICVDGVEFIKFGFDPFDDIVMQDKAFTINVIGKIGVNTYEGKQTPQVIIEDFDIVKK